MRPKTTIGTVLCFPCSANLNLLSLSMLTCDLLIAANILMLICVILDQDQGDSLGLAPNKQTGKLYLMEYYRYHSKMLRTVIGLYTFIQTLYKSIFKLPYFCTPQFTRVIINFPKFTRYKSIRHSSVSSIKCHIN